MKAIVTYSALLLAFVMSACSTAHHRDAYRGHNVWARVVDVGPVYQIVRIHAPERHCWTETHAIESHSGDPGSSTLAGGLIGGTIGHALGHGRRDEHVTTAVGAIIGMAVGSEIGRKRPHEHYTEYRDVERCEVRHQRRDQQKLVGYDVVYRLHGKLHRTRTNHHPGNRIKVSVNVRPYRH